LLNWKDVVAYFKPPVAHFAGRNEKMTLSAREEIREVRRNITEELV
jgi:hypothetical protein